MFSSKTITYIENSVETLLIRLRQLSHTELISKSTLTSQKHRRWRNIMVICLYQTVTETKHRLRVRDFYVLILLLLIGSKPLVRMYSYSSPVPTTISNMYEHTPRYFIRIIIYGDHVLWLLRVIVIYGVLTHTPRACDCYAHSPVAGTGRAGEVSAVSAAHYSYLCVNAVRTGARENPVVNITVHARTHVYTHVHVVHDT